MTEEDTQAHLTPEIREELDDLLPQLYQELRKIAGAALRGERVGHTLQPTALLNEAYLRLSSQKQVHWKNRTHILAAAARIMRRILVDHARGKTAAKRGGGVEKLPLEDDLVGEIVVDTDLLALDQAMNRLGEIDPQMVRVVELRHFGGLTIEESAEALGISPCHCETGMGRR